MKIIFPILISSLIYCSKLQAQTWSELGTGTNALNANADIYTICLDRSGNVYAAGDFWDTTEHLYVAKWNGTSWSELGTGLAPGYFTDEIQILCSDSAGNIYAGGEFKDDSGNCYVAKWDGSTWSEVGIGSNAIKANGNILSLSFDKHGYLYAAGAFVDTSGYAYVAKWDGTSWTEVGTGSSALNANGAINTIFIDTNDNIYAAGNFTDSGVVDTGGNVYTAMWNGSSWSELGSAGICHQMWGDIQIFYLIKDKFGNLYATGNFRNDGNKCYVAKWDGTLWSELGIGSASLNANNAINIMCFDPNGNLYVAGDFTDTTIVTGGSDEHVYVAKWNGISWSKVGSDFYDTYYDNYLLALCIDASGNIYTAGGLEDTTISYIYIDSVPTSDTVVWHPRYVAEYKAAISSVAPLQTTNGINVYPNPAHTNINVSFNSAVKNFTGSDYYLYDCTGRILQSGKLENAITSIDIAELPLSVYLLKISGQYNANYRVVKE